MVDRAIVALHPARGFCILDLSKRMEGAYEDEPDVIANFLRVGCPSVRGVWVWEGAYADDHADGSWRLPTAAEVSTILGDAPARAGRRSS
jgi:hypothetical protein